MAVARTKNVKPVPRKRRAAAKKRSYRDIFLDKLSEMSQGEQRLIGNRSLKDALAWDDERYDRVKAQLRDENAIIVGRGQGGTVGLASAPGVKALSLFVSYSHADDALKNELMKHLEPLRRLRLIEAWHDRKLKPGEEWDKTISDQLEAADIILLLVSIDFINSPYCYDNELDKALELHEQRKARVVPIILRSCLWTHTPFAKLQALPKDAKAVTAWDDKDAALVNIAEGVKQVAEELMATR